MSGQRCLICVGLFATMSLVGCETGTGRLTPPSPSLPSSAVRPIEPTRPSVPLVTTDGGSVDLGYVKPGSRHRITYLVGNPGDVPLEVTSVKTDCGCTTVVEKPKTIPAGGSARLVVDFVAGKSTGAYTTRAVLLTDSEQRPTIAMTIRANIGVPLAVRPGELDLGPIPAGGRVQATIVLANHGPGRIRLLGGGLTGIEGTVHLPGKAIPAGHEMSISLDLVAGTQAGHWTANLSFRTDEHRQPLLILPIRYDVVSDDSVNEGAMLLPIQYHVVPADAEDEGPE